MSQSATMGGCRTACCAVGEIDRGAAGAQRRAGTCGADRSGGRATAATKRRVSTSSSGSFSSAMARWARAISAAVIWAKSLPCRISRSDTVSRAENLGLLLLRLARPRVRSSAAPRRRAARRPPASSLLLRAPRANAATACAMIFSISAAPPPEDAEGLLEHARNARASSRRRRGASSRNPSRVPIRAVSTASSASSTAPGPTGSPASRSARAK